MRTALSRKPGNRSLGIILTGVLVAVLSVMFGTSMASAHSGGMSMSAATGTHVGTTNGWLHGKTVKFRYTKNFFCKEPPSSGAASHCEIGANYSSIPAADFDPLYVVVPIGFTPKASTLQCPTAGRCIDHPHKVDLSRVFGSSASDTLLPPHSHIVTTAAGHDPEWWNVDTVGVTSQRAWNRIVAHKSYGAIVRMRAHGNTHVTENLTSNLFLFFKVGR
ncbi:MAG: hypothetical protein QOK15_3579 [Nocardioidaceae bacterium]|nr:hypothetical protein [Nocardioidaceae bacterium]